MKRSETELLLLLFLAVGIGCSARAQTVSASDKVVIGQPSIFWHNGEWQTYKDGVWAPYFPSPASASTRISEPRGGGHTLEAVDGSMILRSRSDNEHSDRRPANHHFRNTQGHRAGHPNGGFGEANSLGQTTIGIGEGGIEIGPPNIAIGQTTIGIGQPNGIGQTTIGIGQPTIGIGQPTIGIGQTTIGIGQPTIGIGQPTIGIGQPTIGIGQPTFSPRPSEDNGREHDHKRGRETR